MVEYLISKENLNRLVEKLLKSSRVIAPVEKHGKQHLSQIYPDNIKEIKLDGYRAVESYKAFLFRTIETVASYFDEEPGPKQEPFIFLGVRGCDLEALEVIDRVFLEGEFKDAGYAEKRENVFIIGTDCTACGDTCFCNLVKGKPYPTKLFDLNLSPLENGGFIVEIGSSRGEELIKENRALFSEAPQKEIEEKKEIRERVNEQLVKQNARYLTRTSLSEVHKINLENKVWRKLTKDCVECSCCNFICPSCSCFLLLDDGEKQHRRQKVWDACLKAGYARVAGGANPRGKLFERLQNRYHCKFDYSFDRLGRYTCVGCGRCCAEGCMAKIDMRQVFVELEKQGPLTAKLE